MIKPLVSLVMPTFNRQMYAITAIRCFTQQTYAPVELIIVDDSTEGQLPIPADGRIRYIRLDKKTPTGTKRNIGANAAEGEIIANLDDDDWSHPFRIQDEVQRLFKTHKAVTGYNASILYDENTRQLYKIPGGPPYFASGSSQCYWKSWWKEHPYPDCSFGEDSVFSRTARLADQLAIAEPGKMLVVRRHKNNTSDVYMPKLPKLPDSVVSEEFFQAIKNPEPNLGYMWESPLVVCVEEAVAQFDSPVVDYCVEYLPEVEIR